MAEMRTDLTFQDAWAAAESALPEYWRIRSLIETPGPKVGWEVVATDGRRIERATGATPHNALVNLAAFFRR